MSKQLLAGRARVISAPAPTTNRDRVAELAVEILNVLGHGTLAGYARRRVYAELTEEEATRVIALVRSRLR